MSISRLLLFHIYLDQLRKLGLSLFNSSEYVQCEALLQTEYGHPFLLERLEWGEGARTLIQTAYWVAHCLVSLQLERQKF